MPDISFKCGSCGKHLVIDDVGVGSTINCPSCNVELRVPEPEVSQQSKSQTPVPPLIQFPVISAEKNLTAKHVLQATLIIIGLFGSFAVLLYVVMLRHNSGSGYQDQAQRKFEEILEEFSNRYESEHNGIRLDRIRDERGSSIGLSFGNRMAVSNWIGTIRSISTTSSGDASLEVELQGASFATLGTHDNMLTDLSDHTLIKKGSPLYNQLGDLSPGQRIIFSGSFFPNDTDHFRELSFTLIGSMMSPEYLFSFRDVAKY
jgi:hypothetical protein